MLPGNYVDPCGHCHYLLPLSCSIFSTQLSDLDFGNKNLTFPLLLLQNLKVTSYHILKAFYFILEYS